jgi:hypothetical protein
MRLFFAGADLGLAAFFTVERLTPDLLAAFFLTVLAFRFLVGDLAPSFLVSSSIFTFPDFHKINDAIEYMLIN